MGHFDGLLVAIIIRKLHQI